MTVPECVCHALSRATALFRLLWISIICALGLGISASVAAATYSEDAVKAAFLHRFAAYVKWPADAPSDTPFVIGAVGGEGVAAHLAQVLPTLSIQNRRAQIRKIAEPADLDGVRILYIGPGELGRARSVLRAAADSAILVVTDEQNGLETGAIINFIHIERSVRFEVSVAAAERRGLKIEAGLLSVAARVEGRP